MMSHSVAGNMKKGGDLKSMWERASKKHKIASTSMPTPIPTKVEGTVQSESITPSNEPEIGSSTPIVEDEETNDEALHELELEHDPGKRTPIIGYDVNEQDSVRRRYIALGPCQPKQHDFPTRDIGGNRLHGTFGLTNISGLSIVWN